MPPQPRRALPDNSNHAHSGAFNCGFQVDGDAVDNIGFGFAFYPQQGNR